MIRGGFTQYNMRMRNIAPAFGGGARGPIALLLAIHLWVYTSTDYRAAHSHPQLLSLLPFVMPEYRSRRGLIFYETGAGVATPSTLLLDPPLRESLKKKYCQLKMS